MRRRSELAAGDHVSATARERAAQAPPRRGQAIAAVSSVVVLGGLALLILTSPGWPEVRETFFNWDVFKESFPEVAPAASGSTSSCS